MKLGRTLYRAMMGKTAPPRCRRRSAVEARKKELLLHSETRSETGSHVVGFDH